MIFIFTPQIFIYYILKYNINLNMFLLMIITPIIYLLLTLYLIWKQYFNHFHLILSYIPLNSILEKSFVDSLLFLKNTLLSINRINKIYVNIKVKIIIKIINFAASFMTSKKQNPLEYEYNKLYQDYLNIKKKHTVKCQN